MYRDNFVLDHEINFFCCILNIKKCFWYSIFWSKYMKCH
jgi:hypothetical protein